jgi:hypothetical protein
MSWAPGGVGGGVAEVAVPVPVGEPEVEPVAGAGLGGSTVLSGTALGWAAS